MLLPAEREVWLNAGEPAPRRRFTLAHEVGHWVCQVLEGRGAPIMCRAEVVGVGEGKALEREANVFAAELLMPEELVREGFDGTVNEAAVQFSVSEEAMGWRLYNLKVIDRKPTMKVVEERPN
jgi:Zn-dependent peptidase ImmA (M78 family)